MLFPPGSQDENKNQFEKSTQAAISGVGYAHAEANPGSNKNSKNITHSVFYPSRQFDVKPRTI